MLTVIKIGGSVLKSVEAYAGAAEGSRGKVLRHYRVQRQALVAAGERRLPLVVRAVEGGGAKLDYSAHPA